MKVGFYSPMPPAPTGVADYSAALYRELRRLGDVELDASNADVRLYHLGNNHLHRQIYERALSEPGVVVLHDAVLHHFHLGSMNEQQYVEEFVYNYGAWNADFARELWRSRAHSSTDTRYFDYPMLKRVAERSRAVIVHNPAAAALVKAHAPEANVYEIPHLFVRPYMPAGFEVERLRRRLGLDGTTFLFGVFGHLRESKRVLTILRAFDRVREAADVALMVAGDCASNDLARSLATKRPGLLRADYLPDAEFWLYASAVDACINLRYPAAGETSGIAIRFMGIGKPVLLSDGLEISQVPECVCVRIDTGVHEQPMLAAAMCWLAQSKADADAIGSRARQYIEQQHTISNVVRAYWQALTNSTM